jgi:hypothetical protein
MLSGSKANTESKFINDIVKIKNKEIIFLNLILLDSSFKFKIKLFKNK